MLGKCVNSAQVAFLKNFKVRCATLLLSCPTGFPLQTLPTDLRIKLKNGQGGKFYNFKYFSNVYYSMSWSSTQYKCNFFMFFFFFIYITGDILVDVTDEVAPDLSEFMSSKIVDSSSVVQIADGALVCENVTLSLDYKLYWNENGITRVILTRTVGTIKIINNGM